ncbi:YihY/virulence factor BrkB family protein [Marixanthomonas sp. SCSIO 43207]|uniref:YihY/virulence factor BrkB family protein n=1 Tax=Marixanthomonas sp. SCSIO 43207 TaxID=2779360 RepID=UPI001CA8EA6C|nr:YihY/virulence factor BrkB family protein [Marixanthomonas sp. SCSIO 43207]UAB80726.1 YihY/virulence factor BrkB family protein [Marixanthomonas sp. SCSIO 43207]
MIKLFLFLKQTYLSWDKNDPWAKSAVIAYYALFSLPSLLMITVHIAGIFYGPEAVQGKITEEIGGLIGQGSAKAIETMIANATIENSSIFTISIGIGMLIFSATGVFFQLQKALNDIWSVRAKEEGFVNILKRRATSFGLVLAIGLLLLIALVISAAISAISNYLSAYYSEASSVVVTILNFIISEVFITALFASIFTILPDVKIKWKTTLLGALFTSFLFLIGKYILGFYFSQANPASVYGAAGSVVLILLWVYYTCLILFFGAELTVNWALHRNIQITPTKHAIPSYEVELAELRAYKEKIEDDRKKTERLKNS